MIAADVTDDLYLDLKGARLRLCRAQVEVDVLPHAHAHRGALQEAIDIIDHVGSFLPQWSKYDLPPLPEDPS